MITSDKGIKFIETFEGFRSSPYQDQRGIPTIGYGHKIRPDETFTILTEDQATDIFKQDLKYAENGINKSVKIDLMQHEFDALVSFAYNVGVGAFISSTLLRLLNLGNSDLASSEFDKWNHITKNGESIIDDGLTRRRTAEHQLFSKGTYV